MRNLIEARAAFAELVTAAQAAIPAIETLREIARAKRGSASDIAVINLSAALARVNGGAA